MSRLVPFIRAWDGLIQKFSGRPFDDEQLWPPLLSINTWRPEVVEAVLPVGGDLLNDISALPDERNVVACVNSGAALLVMHSVGQPKVPHTHVGYADIMQTLETFFEEKLAICTKVGLSTDQIVHDPGIDFAKQCEDNLTI